MLNTDSPIPLYRQLADYLLTRIRSGQYAPDTRIPSEHNLAQQFNIGRPTVRQATELLVRRGVLARQRGAGTFVRPQPKKIDLFSLTGTSAAFREQGVNLTTRIIQPMTTTSVPPGAENPFSGGNAYHFSRLSTADRQPVLLELMFLHPDLFAGIDRINMQQRSLAEVVREQFYMQPIGGTQQFSIVQLEKGDARRLDVTTETPILSVKRSLHFKQARQAVYAEIFCRTDRFVFTQNLGGTDHEG